MIQIKPWENNQKVWKTESKFWQYIRNQFRKIWSHYPPKNIWKDTQLYPPPADYTGRAKNLGKCSFCNKEFPASHLEVDHIEAAGGFNDWESCFNWFLNLLNDNKNWQLTCKPCHKIKSHSERQNLDFNDAKKEKEIIAFFKNDKSKITEFFVSKGFICKVGDQKKILISVIENMTPSEYEQWKEEFVTPIFTKKKTRFERDADSIISKNDVNTVEEFIQRHITFNRSIKKTKAQIRTSLIIALKSIPKADYNKTVFNYLPIKKRRRFK